MASDTAESLASLTAVQRELRKLARDAAAHSGTRPAMPMLGCRLLHWNPELEKFRTEPSGYVVYQPLNVRVGSRPHVSFLKVYKTKYGKGGRAAGLPERQYGITYRHFDPKSEVTRVHAAFRECALRAGALVGALGEPLASCLPPETVAAENDLHRWIFTTYDVAWQAPAGSPRSATRYVPVTGFDAAMETCESVPYDLDRIRSTPWRKVARRPDRKRWGDLSHLEGAYASWGEELPEYHASRLDDVIQASDWAIDWLVERLSGTT